MYQSIVTNYRLIYIYRRELIAFWMMSILFIISTYVLSKTYQETHLLKKKRAILLEEKVKWQRLGILLEKPLLKEFLKDKQIQEAEIKEKIKLLPFEACLQKLKSIYVEDGFFFLEKLTYKPCKNSPDCQPELLINGKKFYLR